MADVDLTALVRLVKLGGGAVGRGGEGGLSSEAFPARLEQMTKVATLKKPHLRGLGGGVGWGPQTPPHISSEHPHSLLLPVLSCLSLLSFA